MPENFTLTLINALMWLIINTDLKKNRSCTTPYFLKCIKTYCQTPTTISQKRQQSIPHTLQLSSEANAMPNAAGNALFN